MPAGGNIFRFPTTLREVPSVTTYDTGHPQSNAYGFPPVEEDRERVEITSGLTKVYAVRVDGVIWTEYATATNAIRCKELLQGLDRLGALPSPEHPTVRGMLAASVGSLDPEPPEAA